VKIKGSRKENYGERGEEEEEGEGSMGLMARWRSVLIDSMANEVPAPMLHCKGHLVREDFAILEKWQAGCGQ